MKEADRRRSDTSSGKLSDPPTLLDPDGMTGRSGSRPRFAEFAGGTLPAWALVHQRIDATEIGDVRAAVHAALEPVMSAVTPGARVCLAVGSRGIDRIDRVVASTAERLRQAGATVFIVPAMGSHGGATAEGQLEVLASYGITPDAVNCEIRSSMETVALGEVRPGVSVFLDRQAFQGADLVVPINRVKPHTDFTGDIESGLMKMLAIGLGKQKGADTFHRQGFSTFSELIPAVATYMLAHAPIPFGLALVENGHARLRLVEAVPAGCMADRERELLVIARAAMARLPLTAIDVLVVDFIGKDISGLGMDSNVVGRYYAGPTGSGPHIQRIVVRDLTDETEGNAVGIGMADVALRRAVERMDAVKTYMNCVTAKTPEGARIALTVETDREALDVALACCIRVTASQARIARIRDTKHLEWLYASEPLLPELLATGVCEVVRGAHPIGLDRAGRFTDEFPA